MRGMSIVEEAMLVVDNLNDLYYEQTADEERLPFCFHYAGYWMGIKFLGEYIWDNQDNDRGYLEDGDTYEPLLDCINRRVSSLKNTLFRFTGTEVQ